MKADIHSYNEYIILADEATIITISAIKSKIAKNIKNFKERKEFKNYDKGFND